MVSERETLRTALTYLSGFGVFAVVHEFGVEYVKQKGWYDKLPERVEPVVNQLFALAEPLWFKAFVVALVSFTIGLWVDAALRRREGARQAENANDSRERELRIADECIAVSEEIMKERLRWEQSSPDAPIGPDPKNLGDIAWANHMRDRKILTTVGMQFGTRALATLDGLRSLDIAIPQFTGGRVYGEKMPLPAVIVFHLTDVSRFLGVIGQVLRDYGLDRAKNAALRWEVVDHTPDLSPAVGDTMQAKGTVSDAPPFKPRGLYLSKITVDGPNTLAELYIRIGLLLFNGTGRDIVVDLGSGTLVGSCKAGDDRRELDALPPPRLEGSKQIESLKEGLITLEQRLPRTAAEAISETLDKLNRTVELDATKLQLFYSAIGSDERIPVPIWEEIIIKKTTDVFFVGRIHKLSVKEFVISNVTPSV